MFEVRHPLESVAKMSAVTKSIYAAVGAGKLKKLSLKAAVLCLVILMR